MMILKVQSDDKKILDEIATMLLRERKIYTAMFDAPITIHSLSEDGVLEISEQHELKGISKSLMFNDINELIRQQFSHNMPLVYSEPIILIGHEHQDLIIKSLAKI
jgi:hypothetical protein